MAARKERTLWSQYEDESILTLIEKYGTVRKWAVISRELESTYGIFGRSGKQCRERWFNHLDPDVKKQKISADEERLIATEYRRVGNRWTEIAKLFPGKTENAVKNFFYSRIRKKVRKINKHRASADKIEGTIT
jgi:myb proto-oncogene protein